MNEAIERELFPVEPEEDEAPAVEEPVDQVDDAGDTDSDVAEQSEKPAVVEKKDPETIPLASYLEERKEWKHKFGELEQRLERMNKIEQALAEYQQRMQEAQKTNPPDLSEDPVGNLDTRLRELQEQNKAAQEQLRKSQEWQQNQAYISQIGQAINYAEQEVAKAHPDYHQALAYVREKEYAKIKFNMPEMDESQIMARMYQDELAASAFWLNQGRNPAEQMYNLARTVYGYAPAEQEQPAESKEIEKLQKGVKQAKSLGSGASRPQSVEDLTSAAPHEFEAAMADIIAGRF